MLAIPPFTAIRAQPIVDGQLVYVTGCVRLGNP